MKKEVQTCISQACLGVAVYAHCDSAITLACYMSVHIERAPLHTRCICTGFDVELVDRKKVSAPLPRVCLLCVHCCPLKPGDTSLPLNNTAVELNILGSGDSTLHHRVEGYLGWF